MKGMIGEHPMGFGGQSEGAKAATPVDETTARFMRERLRFEQNLPMGILGGVAGAIVGATLWAIIALLTNYVYGMVAILVGCLVGYGNRTFGKGVDKIFGIVGAVLSLLGCVLGDFLCVMITATADGLPFSTFLSMLSPAFILDILREVLGPMDLVFYAFSVVAGFYTSIRQPEKTA